MNTTPMATAQHSTAVVWLDRSRAMVARTRAGRPEVTDVDRQRDPEASYLFRVIHEAADCDRVVIMGPDASRIAFEREYVALYQRPDRLIDIGIEAAPQPRQLVDRLRFLDVTQPI
jgi:hypothetical protein